eukprot:Ihof_evm4s26 gene=Ihof_evmTU4s26
MALLRTISSVLILVLTVLLSLGVAEILDGKAMYESYIRQSDSNDPSYDPDNALLYLVDSAQTNYPPAMERLIPLLLFGEGLPQNIEIAVKYAIDLAALGNAVGNSFMGFFYASGLGVPMDQTKALVHYHLAAVENDMYAHLALGYRYTVGLSVEMDMEKAEKHYSRVAGYVVRDMIETGGHITEVIYLSDHEQSIRARQGTSNDELVGYYVYSAEKGDLDSQIALGRLYLTGGSEVPRDYHKAYRYLKMAADQGSPQGMAGLGQLHEKVDGLGTPPDNLAALARFRTAAESSHSIALYALAVMYHQGTGIVPDRRLTLNWFRTLCERGQWIRHLEKGHMLYKEEDFSRALVHYLYVAETGSEMAQANAAFILDMDVETVIPSEYRYQYAMIYWQRSAKQGNGQSQTKIGDYYYYGRGAPVDYSLAFTSYRTAASANFHQALFDLGFMHETGTGVPQDFPLAQRYYDQSMAYHASAVVPVYVMLARMRV